jgi:hypothetical protein
MKRFILIAWLASFGFVMACNQSSQTKSETKDEVITEADVPNTVKINFTTKYPGATDIRWENAHENEKKTYKAKFSLNGKNFKAEYNEDGVFIKENEDN